MKKVYWNEWHSLPYSTMLSRCTSTSTQCLAYMEHTLCFCSAPHGYFLGACWADCWHTHSTFSIGKWHKHQACELWSFFKAWDRLQIVRTIEVKQKLFKQKLSCRVPTLVWSSDHHWNEMGVTVMFQSMTQLGFTVVMWQHSEIWLVLPTFWKQKYVAVWTHGSCQAVSPGFGLGTRL